jgi:hypothetical protein
MGPRAPAGGRSAPPGAGASPAETGACVIVNGDGHRAGSAPGNGGADGTRNPSPKEKETA